MNKRLFLILGILLLFAPIVAAASTELNVKTEPYHSVTFSILANTEAYNLIKTLKGFAYGDGIATIEYDGDQSEVAVNIIVRDGEGTVLESEKFMDINIGETHYFIVNSDEAEKVDGPFESSSVTEEASEEDTETPVDESAEETTGEVSEEDAESAAVTGQVVDEQGISGTTNYLFYIIGAVAIVGIIGLVFARKSFMKRPPHMVGAKKEDGDETATKQEVNVQEKAKDENDDEIAYAEKRIREAQAEITKLKRREREISVERELKEREKELEDKREELKRLRSQD